MYMVFFFLFLMAARVYCPSSITTIADPFSETATVYWPPVGESLTTTPPNGSLFRQGVKSVTVTGREDECIFYVYVEGM